jgi:hypothetical protein
MSLQQNAGVVMLAGVVLFVIAMIISPRLYQEPDITLCERIVEAHRGRWNVSQLSSGWAS